MVLSHIHSPKHSQSLCLLFFYIFHRKKALKKSWKMHASSSKTIFLLSRCLIFCNFPPSCPTFYNLRGSWNGIIVMPGNGLQKLLIVIFWITQLPHLFELKHQYWPDDQLLRKLTNIFGYLKRNWLLVPKIFDNPLSQITFFQNILNAWAIFWGIY